ncbi:hypothetical protein K0M31_009252 [Melipona bicolor]|uniref:Uncharacterized protein n=1 Tax=Melipona bicolor TaxID=60889 RepID=A0AA40FPV9_9HYME|nr:hypothetical protein K0M31_009252 [Melipona bicolor]
MSCNKIHSTAQVARASRVDEFQRAASQHRRALSTLRLSNEITLEQRETGSGESAKEGKRQAYREDTLDRHRTQLRRDARGHDGADKFNSATQPLSLRSAVVQVTHFRLSEQEDEDSAEDRRVNEKATKGGNALAAGRERERTRGAGWEHACVAGSATRGETF